MSGAGFNGNKVSFYIEIFCPYANCIYSNLSWAVALVQLFANFSSVILQRGNYTCDVTKDTILIFMHNCRCCTLLIKCQHRMPSS